MSVVVYPLNDIDFHAEDVGIYNATRTSGIYADNDFALSVTGADNTVSVDVGLGWMRLSKFFGVAVALKNKTAVDMGLPDSVYPRIDAVALQFDANKNGAEVIAKKGIASSTPQPPALSQTEALYELHLAHVYRNPSAVSITAADVSDMRLSPVYCGLMADAVSQVDTAAIDAQISALVQKLRDDLAAVEGETYYASKDYVKTRKTSAVLYASGWIGSGPYTQSISVADLTDDRNAFAYVNVPENAQTEAELQEESVKVSSCRRDGSTLIFRCLEDKPSKDIPVIVEVYV